MQSFGRIARSQIIIIIGIGTESNTFLFCNKFCNPFPRGRSIKEGGRQDSQEQEGMLMICMEERSIGGGWQRTQGTPVKS